VVAAGGGTRFGGAKQYARLLGRSVLWWSVDAARAACDGVVVVVPEGDLNEASVQEAGGDRVVAGGATRSASVRCGLAAVPPDAAVVVVHDAARPLAGKELFARAIGAVRAGADGAFCGVAIADTVVEVDGDAVTATLDRDLLVAVQTPQAFTAAALRKAHESGAEATDDASLVLATGGKVMVVAGDDRNIKLTRRADLDVVAFFAQSDP
jgi:2-C-methyl-D-erythritol 4-phosphate cytidylyltransferase